jgi:uncharacterized protein YqjF (DUF2071 family)
VVLQPGRREPAGGPRGAPLVQASLPLGGDPHDPGSGAPSPRSGDAAGRFSYASRRRGSRQAADCSLQYGPTGAVAPAVPGTLEYFLVERYVLYAWSRGRLSRAQVHHEPYPVQAATVEDLQETLSVAAGVSEKGNRLSPLYAREVTVDIFPPRSLA